MYFSSTLFSEITPIGILFIRTPTPTSCSLFGPKLHNCNHANLFISYRSDVEEMFPIKTKVCEHSDECILSHNYWYHIVFYWLLLYYMFLLMIASVKFLSQILSMLFEWYRLIFTMHLVSFYILFSLDM